MHGISNIKKDIQVVATHAENLALAVIRSPDRLVRIKVIGYARL